MNSAASAVVQCGDDGHVYAYDLGSTHGTKINKAPVQHQSIAAVQHRVPAVPPPSTPFE